MQIPHAVSRLCHPSPSRRRPLPLMLALSGLTLAAPPIWASNAAKVDADTTAPTVSFVSPTDGQEISGKIKIEVQARDDVQVSCVDLYIDNTYKTAMCKASPNAIYSYYWTPSSKKGRNYVLKALAYDTSQNQTWTAPLTVRYTPATGPTNGQCGSANGQAFPSAPSSGLCAAGAASALAGTGPWTWTCAGTGGGTSASCRAELKIEPPTPVNGKCGPANGQAYSSAPTSGLCSVGLASAIYGTGPWTWACAGSNGGSTVGCRAEVKIEPPAPVNGRCGSANGSTTPTAPTSNLCAVGTATSVSGSGPWQWGCQGSNGGSTDSCRAYPPASGDDLCANFPQDKLARPMSAMAKPSLGQVVVDPQFGGSIRRISDAAAGRWNVAKPMYSTIQAWNADESYLILYHTSQEGAGSPGGHHLYDGKTYRYLKPLDIRPADLEQVYWDTSNPKILYYADRVTRKLHRFNVETDTHATSAVIHDFSRAPTSCTASEDLIGGSDPMFTSWDSKQLGFSCGRRLFSYNLATDTVGKIVTMTTGEGGSQNAPQASASGNTYFLNYLGRAGYVLDKDMNVLRQLNLPSSNEHGSLGMQDGRDTFFSVQFDAPLEGSLVASDMTTGASRVLIGPATGYPYPPSGTHMSALAYRNPGWLALSIVGDARNGKMGQGLLENEILLVNTNQGGKTCRLAHHRSCGGSGACGNLGYWAEPHVVISPTGTRLLFGSDWGGERTVDTYVIELPAYRR